MLEMNDTFFKILFDEGYRTDAKNLFEYAQYARNLVCDFYEYTYDEKIIIKNFKNSEAAKEHGENLDWQYMRSKWEINEIYCLTESEAPLGYDHIWYRANIVHEYIHCYLGRYSSLSRNY